MGREAAGYSCHRGYGFLASQLHSHHSVHPSLTCSVCQRELKRKNFPPPQIHLHFINFFLHFVLVGTGKPCSPATVLRPAISLGRRPPSALQSTNLLLLLGPCLASLSHDRIKVTTVSGDVDFLFSGREWSPEKSGERNMCRTPTDRVVSGPP